MATGGSSDAMGAGDGRLTWLTVLSSSPLMTRRTPGTLRAKSTASCSCSGLLTVPVNQTSGPSTLTFRFAPRRVPSVSAVCKSRFRFCAILDADSPTVSSLMTWRHAFRPPRQIQDHLLLGGGAHAALQPDIAILNMHGHPETFELSVAFGFLKLTGDLFTNAAIGGDLRPSSSSWPRVHGRACSRQRRPA